MGRDRDPAQVQGRDLAVLLEAAELEEAALLLAVVADLLSEELELEVVVVLRLA